MVSGKPLQLRGTDGFLQPIVLKLRHRATFRTNHVMVGFVLVGPLVLGRTAELVPDDQVGIHQQDDGVVEGSPTYPEVAFRLHVIIEHVNVKMSLYGIDGIENSIAFGRLSMSVLLQIVGQHLLDCISYVFFHTGFCSASKVKPFYDNLKV